MSQDEQNLNLLGIFHYVAGGVAALFAFFPVFHLIIGILIVSGKLHGNDPAPAVLGWVFAIVAGGFMLVGWILSALMIMTGKFLRRRRHRRFCFIVACIECIFMPFGTTLGVFTIILLNKDEVRQLFASQRRELGIS